MNFLLHYHLAARDLRSEAAGLGAMLPDFWRMSDRRMRAREVAASGEPGRVADLLAGIRHHLDADRWFHRHPVFLDGEKLSSACFRAASFRASKVLILAHPAWELGLDGALVRERGAVAIQERLRAVIAETGSGPLRTVSRLHGLERRLPDKGSRRDFHATLSHLLERLVQGEWIPGYAHPTGLAARVEGLRRRLGLEPLSEPDRRRLEGCCSRLLDEVVRRLPEILAPSRESH